RQKLGREPYIRIIMWYTVMVCNNDQKKQNMQQLIRNKQQCRSGMPFLLSYYFQTVYNQMCQTYKSNVGPIAVYILPKHQAYQRYMDQYVQKQVESIFLAFDDQCLRLQDKITDDMG